MYPWFLLVMALAFTAPAASFERVVLLAPAAGDIMLKLGLEHKVVGVTRSNYDFPNAVKVGSHVKPNIELIHSLQPDLIIIGNARFFGAELQRLFDASIYSYQPKTLMQIQQAITDLGAQFQVVEHARLLNQQLTTVLNKITPVKKTPNVVYEITELPLTIAGSNHIVADIISIAGGRLLAPEQRSLIRYNVESIVTKQPDLYLYQQGPMNASPSEPNSRPQYQSLTMETLKVDQLQYTRANSQSFYLALELNRYIQHRF
ncbi:ABC transporter substrate-binding protein [Ferrimonas aestuarii]|nr:ABC transporter substrate-binding protein [Ferrimonas aestuarii]